MIESEKLFDEIYHRTQDFGRVHFVREIQRLMIENKDLKEDRKFLFEENHNKEQVIIKQKEIIDKVIGHIEDTKNKMVMQDRYYIDGDILLEILKENSNE